MLQGNYDQILKLISESSNLPVDEITRRIEAKRAKLSGLIRKEGAAQIIASELGISFDKQKMKISGLLPGMRKINLVGKVIRVNRIVEYNKNGRSGKIGSLQIADDTSNIRVVLWDVNHIGLLEKGIIKEGDVIEINNADVRNSEIHLTGFSDIKLSQAVISNPVTQVIVQKKIIKEVNINDNVSLRAFVVQIFGPTFYNTCPECNKKVSETLECEAHGKVVSKRRAILTLILDDGTENIRALFFSDQITKLAGIEITSPEDFVVKRNELLGQELFFEGSVRKNRITDNMELFVNNFQVLDLDKLISDLDK